MFAIVCYTKNVPINIAKILTSFKVMKIFFFVGHSNNKLVTKQ